MKKITVVIGANYGDEGKGRAVSYFSKNHSEEEKKYRKLVIRFNGGSQAGHTVVNKDRIVFGHFGSGSSEEKPVDTYLSKNFIVNPMFFRKEYEKLKDMGYNPKVYVNEDCLVTTVFDVFINQAWETFLGDKRYGSCGAGIYETVVRNEQKEFKTTVSMIRNSKNCISKDFIALIKKIETDYFQQRLYSVLKSDEVPEPYDKIMKNNLSFPYLKDVLFFLHHVNIIRKEDEKSFLSQYDHLIFEGAQGLLLDQSREEKGENVTPSNTGLKNAFELISNNGFADSVPVEVCYCTRCYMTRHGNGKLNREKPKNKISKKIIDLTNVPNEFQGKIRFASLDLSKLYIRTMRDFTKYADKKPNWKISFMVNCLDQIDKKIEVFSFGEKYSFTEKDFGKFFTRLFMFEKHFGNIYLGKGPNATDTIKKGKIVYKAS